MIVIFGFILRQIAVGIIKQNVHTWHIKERHIYLLREILRLPVNVVTAEPSTRPRSTSTALLREKIHAKQSEQPPD
jgi:hypothetical protein